METKNQYAEKQHRRRQRAERRRGKKKKKERKKKSFALLLCGERSLAYLLSVTNFCLYPVALLLPPPLHLQQAQVRSRHPTHLRRPQASPHREGNPSTRRSLLAPVAPCFTYKDTGRARPTFSLPTQCINLSTDLSIYANGNNIFQTSTNPYSEPHLSF